MQHTLYILSGLLICLLVCIVGLLVVRSELVAKLSIDPYQLTRIVGQMLLLLFGLLVLTAVIRWALLITGS